MSEFEAQDAFTLLIEKIDEGFNRLADKLDEHAKEDNRLFKEYGERINTLETRNKILWGAIATVGVPVSGILIKWIFNA